MLQNLLMLNVCGDMMPGGVRRLLDYLPYLAERNIQPTVLDYRSPYLARLKLSHPALAPGNGICWAAARKAITALSMLRSELTLAQLVLRARQFNAVFVQTACPRPALTRLLKRANENIIFDFDDAIFLNTPQSTDCLARQARFVTVGSHYLLEYALQRNPRSVLIPTPIPVDCFSVPDEMREEPPVINIGWIGSVYTLKYLEVVRRPLDALAERHRNVKLTVIGCGNHHDRVPLFEKIALELVPRIPPEEVPRYVGQFDIGLMPLFDTEWEKGKCALKALECMAAGKPVVCSPVGENNYVVDDGQNGFLADSEEEWVEKLSLLVTDPQLRRRLGLAGRERVEQSYATEVCFRELHEKVLSQLA